MNTADAVAAELQAFHKKCEDAFATLHRAAQGMSPTVAMIAASRLAAVALRVDGADVHQVRRTQRATLPGLGAQLARLVPSRPAPRRGDTRARLLRVAAGALAQLQAHLEMEAVGAMEEDQLAQLHRERVAHARRTMVADDEAQRRVLFVALAQAALRAAAGDEDAVDELRRRMRTAVGEGYEAP